MFSTLTERGAAATLEALALGASDYVTKPANVGSVAGVAWRASATSSSRGSRRSAPRAAAAPPSRLRRRGQPVGSAPAGARRARRPCRAPARPAGAASTVVAVGVSTGGPDALADVLPALPADLPVPIVVVQHMPPVFTRLLAERLDGRAPLPVREAAGRRRCSSPARCYIAPGDHHLSCVRRGAGVGRPARPGRRRRTPAGRPSTCCSARSPGLRPGARSAVVLTGMGQDGPRRRGGDRGAPAAQVVVQDEATSVVWGMPGAVARAGLADAVLPLDAIAPPSRTRRRAGPAAAARR